MQGLRGLTRWLCAALVASAPMAARADGEAELADSIAASLGDESSVDREQTQRLIGEIQAFASEVNATAKRRTLALCEGYRRARGLDPRGGHDRYMIPAEESLREWGNVFSYGLSGPLSAIAGIKADSFNFIKPNISTDSAPALARSVMTYSNYSLFQSLNAYFLVRSMGFLDGAMHCLNTMDQGEINRFAFAILEADGMAGGATQGAMFAVGGRVIGALIARPLRWLARPAVALWSRLTLKAKIGSALAVGSVAVTLAVQKARAAWDARQQSAQLYESLADPARPVSPGIQMAGRILQLNGLVELIAVAYDPALSSSDRKVAADRLSAALAHITPAQGAEWEARFQALAAEFGQEPKGALSEAQKIERAEYYLLASALPELRKARSATVVR